MTEYLPGAGDLTHPGARKYQINNNNQKMPAGFDTKCAFGD